MYKKSHIFRALNNFILRAKHGSSREKICVLNFSTIPSVSALIELLLHPIVSFYEIEMETLVDTFEGLNVIHRMLLDSCKIYFSGTWQRFAQHEVLRAVL